MSIAIFGGTAAYHLNPSDFAVVAGVLETQTEFGPVSFTRLVAGRGVEVMFLSRHGSGNLARSAAFINHRAHVVGASRLGAQAILSWNGVGAINPALAVGDLVVPDDLIDETRARISPSYPPLVKWNDSFRASGELVQAPFSEILRRALLEAAAANHQSINANHATFVCTEGPRLETPAEIAAYAQLGADVVGMTLCPEIWLAGEIGLPYASLCAVTNMAAGLSHVSPVRDFGPVVGAKCLRVCIRAAEILSQ